MAKDDTAVDEDTSGAQRTPEHREALARLQKLAREQGVKPLDFDKLLAKAGFWPEDESIDEFITTIRKWRGEGTNRKLS